jgi:hypothetical protein
MEEAYSAQSAATLKKKFTRDEKETTDFANALAAIRALHDAGVPVLAGTDAPNPGTAHGASIHRELELLVKAGLTEAQALAAATSLPASAFGLSDRGRIAPGLRADLVLVKGDPASDITATRDIVSIWKAGFPADRDSLKAAVAKEIETAEAARKAPPPEGLAEGLISDFEDGSLKTRFGSGFVPATDVVMGGKSTAELTVVDSGPGGRGRALRIAGVISDASPHAWAGAQFSPGPSVSTEANLSSKKALRFFTKGDGRVYVVLLFTKAGGFLPAQKKFASGASWSEVVIPFAELGGTDGRDVTAIVFDADSTPGAYSFLIDDVRLE